MSALPLAADAPLLARARAGDPQAFELLTRPHLRPLQVHCYRMLGSLHDAEDAVQETLLRAWRRLDSFEGRASLRTWLFRIATNVSLDAIARRPPRVLPDAIAPPADPAAVPAPEAEDVVWIGPYPDALLDELHAEDPAHRYDARESIELAFVAAMQKLPPLQRAVVILRDVLGFSPHETAAILDRSVASVNSALQRARASSRPEPARVPAETEARLVAAYVRAWEDADVDALVALLREDATMSMPPTPSWYAGRESIRIYFAALFAGEFGGRLVLVPTRANRGPALAVYLRDEQNVARAFAIKVLTVRAGEIESITGFTDPSLFAPFGLPEALVP